MDSTFNTSKIVATMNKDAVKEGFAGCFGTYSTEAVAQQRIAIHLAELLECSISNEPRYAVEVGCGSGFLTEQLLMRFPNVEWLHNDIASSSEAFVGLIAQKYHAPNTHFRVADAERMELKSGIDLFASSSAVQWFTDLDSYLQRLSNSLNRGGIAAISTFGPNNLAEVKALTGNGLQYHSLDELKEMVKKYFDVVIAEEDQMKVYFAEPLDVLRHIKMTGVNGAFRQGWTKGRLALFNLGYESYRTNEGVPLTYHPIYLILRKR